MSDVTEKQCLHEVLMFGTSGWYCGACLRMFLPSGDTGAEQETVRLRYLLNEARAYVCSFAELTRHPTASADAMKLVERIDGLRPAETTAPTDHVHSWDGDECHYCHFPKKSYLALECERLSALAKDFDGFTSDTLQTLVTRNRSASEPKEASL